MDNLNSKTKQIFYDAQAFASKLNHQRLLPEHLLKIMISENDHKKILVEAGSDINYLKNMLDEFLNNFPKVIEENKNSIYLDKETKILINNLDQKILSEENIKVISPEDMTLAMLVVKELNVSKLLLKSGVDINRLKDSVNNKKALERNPNSNQEHLDIYARDLTKEASEGKLDPVIGRDEEIRRAIQVLSRRTKNNPILLGEPGVGKTAIVEGLALRIVNDDVPEILKNKKIMSLDMGQLLAGAKFRGEFEERLKAVLKEVSKSKDSIIMFIDEIHTIVGAGASEGSMDASNLLKPQLARGELHCIRATTLKEH